MRTSTILPAGLALAMACTSQENPTQPETEGDPAAAVQSFTLAAANTWTAKAPRPGIPLFGTSAGVVPNSAGHSIVYVLGGTDGEGGSGFPTAAYDATTNTWTDKGTASRVYVFNSNGVGKIGTKLYFSGGYDYGSGTKTIVIQVWAYDAAANRLIRKLDMPKATADGVTGVINGKLYVLPGTCSGDLYPDPRYCAQDPIRRLFRYDPVTNTWLARRAAPHFHKRGAAGVINGKLYVAGGFNDFDPVADLDVYDPSTNTWTTLAPIPTAGGAAGAVLQGKLFVVAWSGSQLHAYAYDPATNKWQTKAAPASAPDAVVRVTIDGHNYLLAVGPSATELYTP